MSPILTHDVTCMCVPAARANAADGEEDDDLLDNLHFSSPEG
jgi:hypothetical protein